MRQENLLLSTAASQIIKRDQFEVVLIINPSSTGITAYLNLRGGPATSADVPILSGGAPFVITLGVSDIGASIVAASATPTVILLRESFQSYAEFLAFGPIFIAVASSLASYWIAVSSTRVALAGAFTEAQADAFDAKTAATGVRLGASLPSGGVGVGSVALGAGDVNVGIGTTYTAYAAGNTITERISNTIRRGLSSTSSDTHNATASNVYNGTATDPRLTFSVTAFTILTPAAGGSISSVYKTKKVPIADGVVVSAADILISAGNNRVKVTTAITDVAVVGQAVSGATGNAGGTVLAEVIDDAALIGTIVTGAAGTVAGQFIILAAGVGEVNKADSSTVRTNASFGRATSTASGGAVADYWATGPT